MHKRAHRLEIVVHAGVGLVNMTPVASLAVLPTVTAAVLLIVVVQVTVSPTSLPVASGTPSSCVA